MNSFKQITSGLSSSLFLAIGLTRLAEKTDPSMLGSKVQQAADGRSGRFCGNPCNFTPQAGQ